jgi:protein-S-isoprenylcysteine O-methyltransferase
MNNAPPYLFLASNLWAAVFGVTFLAFNISAMWVTRRERGLAKGQMRDRGSRLLIYALSPLGMIAAFAAPYLAPWAKIAFSGAPVFFTGIAMMWAGTFLYPWAAITLGTAFRTQVQLLDDQKLITAGPYRIVRHPAYLAGTLIFTGIGLCLGNWFSVAATAGTTILGYAWRVHVEEQALAERFGEAWTAHKKRTFAVLPPIW